MNHVSEREQIELYISSSIKHAFTRVSWKILAPLMKVYFMKVNLISPLSIRCLVFY